MHMSERYTNPDLQALADEYQVDQYGRPGLPQRPHDAARRHAGPGDDGLPRVRPGRRQHVQDLATTSRRRISDSWLSRQTRRRRRPPLHAAGSNGVLALRFKGFKSWGRNPDFMLLRRQLRDARLRVPRSSSGRTAFFANAELRFPLIEAMLTPLGVLGGLRGVFFANIGGASFNRPGLHASARSKRRALHAAPRLPGRRHLRQRRAGLRPIRQSSTACASIDGRASYGIGLESFLLGFPMHFDWSWKTLFNRDWEDAFFASVGGSDAFRKVKFSFWIGYDF